MAINLQDLRESNEFLNYLLDNMGAAVLIADENYQIHQFNDSFLDLFDSAAGVSTMKSFGEVSGCVNAVKENKACGETSACAGCVLRHSLIQTLVADAPVNRKPLDRIFYIRGRAVQKYLRFNTRRIVYRGRTMILVIIYDVSDIEHQKVELQRKQALIDEDLKAAAAIQRSLLPEGKPSIPNLQVAWEFDPCERIGGDIFNIQRVDNDHVGLYMIDVCGHGVPAALISVAASQYLAGPQGLLGSGCQLASPETVLNHINAAFPFERFDSYLSIVCMSIDIRRGILTYSGAGHPPPLLLRACEKLETLDHRGPVIGFGSGAPYSQSEVRLEPGDKIILYTDGLTENRGLEGRAFGRETLYKILRDFGSRPVDELIRGLHAAVRAFLKNVKPDDDISVLGIEYTGPAANHYII
ncbi:MAG: SpoIIE family protein phosphatase [Desulfobacteraceae bacterium]|jgi:sigma-B regulation protein RsbU (phosphoserine phosphatase)|nr:SpoIIE family protein phosphatase [Desulfobacteraceae bacterium]